MENLEKYLIDKNLSLYRAWVNVGIASEATTYGIRTRDEYNKALVYVSAMWGLRRLHPGLESLVLLLTEHTLNYLTENLSPSELPSLDFFNNFPAITNASQEKVSELLRVTIDQVAHYQSGERILTGRQIIALSDYFNVNPVEFLRLRPRDNS